MGRVYKAQDTRLGRVVAVKISEERFSERFEREARTVAALNHPNICTLYDVGPNYLVMEFVEGAPIAAMDGPQTILDLAMQLVDGVAAAHALRIVHRDLKPGNILVTPDGRIKILDFGLATIAASSAQDPDSTLTMGITDPGTAVGTIAYMSPEQARGQEVDTRSDLWSLGVILYEITTGSRPFEGPTAAVIFAEILGLLRGCWKRIGRGVTSRLWNCVPTSNAWNWTATRRRLRCCIRRALEKGSQPRPRHVRRRSPY
jgi:serine/threonine protein kinase